MVVWVDADACPAQIKEILFRAAERVQVQTVLVANHALRVPKSRFIQAKQVESGFDVADARIVAALAAGDLVITADVPLAAQVVAAKAFALNPRGTLVHAGQRSGSPRAPQLHGRTALVGRNDARTGAARQDGYSSLRQRARQVSDAPPHGLAGGSARRSRNIAGLPPEGHPQGFNWISNSPRTKPASSAA